MKSLLYPILFVALSSPMFANVLDVTDFGAVGNGNTLNTTAIQAAIDSATINGDTVLIPSGTFMSGTLILKNDVTLQIDGTLKGSGKVNDYPEITPSYRSYADYSVQRSFLYAEGQHNITLTGNGTFDGNGSALEFFTNNSQRPYGMRFISCTNLTIENLKLRSSGFWMMHNLNIDTLTIRNLDIFNHANGNNDGINADGCRNVYIGNCTVDSGDDPIVLKGMSLAIMENVVVENCTVATYSRALKIGTETNGGFRNIHIHDIEVVPTTFSIPGVAGAARTGINLSIVDGGYMDSVLVENINMTGIQTPIFIRLGNRARGYQDTIPVTQVGSINNVTLRNITAVGESNITSMISGIPGYYVQNVLLENIDLTVPGGMDEFRSGFSVPENENGKPESDMFGDSIPAYGLYLRHADGIELRNFCVTTQSNDTRSFIVTEDVINTPDYEPESIGNANCAIIVASIDEVVSGVTKIYPNPVSSLLHLDLQSNTAVSYTITNLLGQTVASGLSQGSIDVSRLQDGYYLLHFEGNRNATRIIVAH